MLPTDLPPFQWTRGLVTTAVDRSSTETVKRGRGLGKGFPSPVLPRREIEDPERASREGKRGRERFEAASTCTTEHDAQSPRETRSREPTQDPCLLVERGVLAKNVDQPAMRSASNSAGEQ